MLRRLIRDWRQLRYALYRYYRKRARRVLTPEQEYEQAMRELRYRQELARRRDVWR